MIDITGFDSIFSLVPAVFLLGLYVMQARHTALVRRWMSWIVIVASSAFFMLLLAIASARFSTWREGLLAQEVIPPFTGMSYFLSYAGFRLFGQYVVSFFAAGIVFGGFAFINKKSGGRVCESEEPYSGGIAAFLCGWPGIVAYVAVILVAGLMGSAYARAAKKRYFSLYYVWLPAAILVILLREQIFDITGLWVLEFSRTF